MFKPLFVLLTVVAVSTGPVSGADSTGAETLKNPVEAVPQTAGVIIKVKTPQVTTQKIVNFLNQVDPRVGQQAQMGSMGLGMAISNATLAGIDQKGDWWVAVFPHADKEPDVLFAVQATDVKAMKQAVGEDFVYVEHNNWQLYTESEDLAKAVEARIGGKGKSIATVIDRTSWDMLDGGDISLYVNVQQLVTTYRDQIDVAKQRVEAQLDQLSNFSPEVPGVNMRGVFEMYGDMFRGLLQATEDTDGAAAALSVRARSIDLDEYVRFVPESKTAKYLDLLPTSELKPLAKLPSDQLGYFGLSMDMAAVTKWSTEFSMKMLDVDEEQKKAMKTALDGMGKLKIGDYVGAMNLGDLETGALRVMGIMQVDQPEKMRDLTRTSYETIAKVKFGVAKAEIDYKKGAEKYGDHAADIMITKQTFDEALDPQGFQQQIHDAIYGPAGMVQRMVFLDDRIVTTIGGGKPEMTKALQAAESDEDSDAGPHVQVQKRLLEQANVLGMVDLPNLAADVFRLAFDSGKIPVPVTPKRLDDLKLERSYLGFSMGAVSDGLRSRTHLPAVQAQGVAKLVNLFMGLRAQPQF